MLETVILLQFPAECVRGWSAEPLGLSFCGCAQRIIACWWSLGICVSYRFSLLVVVMVDVLSCCRFNQFNWKAEWTNSGEYWYVGMMGSADMIMCEAPRARDLSGVGAWIVSCCDFRRYAEQWKFYYVSVPDLVVGGKQGRKVGAKCSRLSTIIDAKISSTSYIIIQNWSRFCGSFCFTSPTSR